MSRNQNPTRRSNGSANAASGLLVCSPFWARTPRIICAVPPGIDQAAYRLSARTESPAQAVLAGSGGLAERQDALDCDAQVAHRSLRGDATPRCALEEPELEQVRLVDVLDGVGLLSDGGSERRQAHRTAAELLDHRRQDRQVELVESPLVDLEQLEAGASDVARDAAVVTDLGEVADAPKQAVGDARRSPGAPGDLVGAVEINGDGKDPGRAPNDAREIVNGVVVEAGREPEPLPQRERDPAGTRRGADEREPRQVKADAARAWPLAEDDVELEVLERGVEHLLHRAGHPVDLVDEQDVPLLEVGEDRREVAGPIERRSRRGAEPDAELVGEDAGERRLAQPGGPREQHVIDRLPAGTCAVDEEGQLLLDPLLPDELVEPPWAQRGVELAFLVTEGHVDHPGLVGHARPLNSLPDGAVVVAHPRPTCCNATRSSSSTGRSSLPSIARMASVASCGESPSDRSASRTSASGTSSRTTSPPSLSLRSRTTRWATFLPTPGTIVSAATSPARTARRRASGDSTDRNDSATFGPTPVTLTSRSNSSRSSPVANPNNVMASSRRTIRVWSFAALPTGGRLASVDADTWTS